MLKKTCSNRVPNEQTQTQTNTFIDTIRVQSCKIKIQGMRQAYKAYDRLLRQIVESKIVCTEIKLNKHNIHS